MSKSSIELEVAGRVVTVTSPEKLYFPEAPYTKLDVVRYFLAVSESALRGIVGRPLVLRRFVNGARGESFFQKRAPRSRPAWVETVVLSFPSGRTAEEIVVHDAAQLVWVANLGCLELHAHPVRATDLEHPDELRLDLDPVPGVEWRQIVDVAEVTRVVLEDLELVGWPKTSGSRGVHINVRIAPEHGFDQVRRAALAIAREVEKRAPELATSAWWKEERHGVFLDYNQNAKDRTVAAAYSVRPTPDARVSMPLTWQRLATCDPAEFTLATVPGLLERDGDAAAGIDEAVGSLEPALELVQAQESAGQVDAPWPPHYRRRSGEPPRVTPSRRKKKTTKQKTTKKKTAKSQTAKRPQPDKKTATTTSARRRTRYPLLTIAKARYQKDALAGFERWKGRHPRAAEYLEPSDVLVDSMRGRSSTWTRIRVNLRHVPEAHRPGEEPPDPDYDPWAAVRAARKGS